MDVIYNLQVDDRSPEFQVTGFDLQTPSHSPRWGALLHIVTYMLLPGMQLGTLSELQTAFDEEMNRKDKWENELRTAAPKKQLTLVSHGLSVCWFKKAPFLLLYMAVSENGVYGVYPIANRSMGNTMINHSDKPIEFCFASRGFWIRTNSAIVSSRRKTRPLGGLHLVTPQLYGPKYMVYISNIHRDSSGVRMILGGWDCMVLVYHIISCIYYVYIPMSPFSLVASLLQVDLGRPVARRQCLGGNHPRNWVCEIQVCELWRMFI